MRNNTKYLLKNVGLLTLSNFGSKILVFLLVPIYTRLLSTEEYGIYDIYLTTITLLIPILSLNIVEAVMRFALDKKIEKSKVLSIGIKIVIKSILYCTILIIINYFTNFINIFNKFPQYFLLYYALNIIYDLVTQFAKSIDKIFDFAIASILNSLTMLLLNIVFLVVFKMKLNGYFLANCLAFAIPIVYLSIRLKLWKYIRIKSKDEELKKQMIKYSSPLILNNIGWWITNASDRYILTAMKGLSENGIYSVSYKVPSILNVVQAIFSQAWIMSAVKAYDDKENEFIGQTYQIYNCVFVLKDSSKNEFEFPLTHWVMLGLNKPESEGGTSIGYGAYSQEDADYTTIQPSYQDKVNANKIVIKQRLKDFGVKGYIEFLFKKFKYVWNDGSYYVLTTIGWDTINQNSMLYRVVLGDVSNKYVRPYMTYFNDAIFILNLFLIIKKIIKRDMDEETRVIGT